MTYFVTINDKEYEVEVEKGQAELVNITDIAPAAPAAPAAAPVGAGEAMQAPMPGAILDVRVQPGASVKAGQILLILEAMKMENEIVAPRDAVVTQVSVSKGANVNTGDVLLYIQ